MSYAVIFLREFVKQFRRLPRDAKLRVRRRVTELSENPYLGLKLVVRLERPRILHQTSCAFQESSQVDQTLSP